MNKNIFIAQFISLFVISLLIKVTGYGFKKSYPIETIFNEVPRLKYSDATKYRIPRIGYENVCLQSSCKFSVYTSTRPTLEIFWKCVTTTIFHPVIVLIYFD